MSDKSLQEIVCCIGQPVAGNPTQYMIEKGFAAANLDWRCLTLEVAPADLAAAVAGMRAMGFRGATIMAPHKSSAAGLMDELSEAARLMEVINCVHIDHGRLRGENTDGKGFVKALAPLRTPAGLRAEILGAGTVARAIALELLLAGAARLRIVNRSALRGQQLVEDLKVAAPGSPCEIELRDWQAPHAIQSDTDIVINAASPSVGETSSGSAIDLSTLASRMIVAEVTCSSNTPLLRAAADRGCTTLDGLGMLVQQAAISFEIWTGIQPDTAAMRDAIDEFLGF